MNRICTICVRGGSKGVINKNTRILINKPLFLHSLDQAIHSELFDAIAVSTDCEKVKTILKERYPSVYLINRPEHMSSDTAPKVQVIRHCVQSVEEILDVTFRIAVDLDATSPLRIQSDIQGAISLLEVTNAPNIITGAISKRSPYFNLVESLKNGTVVLSKKTPKNVIRRQDVPKSYDMNASVYVWKREVLMRSSDIFHKGTLLFEMPEERSFDIDTELDFKIVEMILKMRTTQ